MKIIMDSNFCMVMAITLALFMINPTYSTPCKNKNLSNKKTNFANCNDLPTLNSTLHFTYYPSTSTLSMSFTARAPGPSSWVSWALNPRDTGMVGAQALIAYRSNPSGPLSVDTFDIKSYLSIVKGPISYNVSHVSAEESSEGHVTIFATWIIPIGQSVLNQVWQVGPVRGGQPGTHGFDQANLGSMMKLSINDRPTAPPEPSLGHDVGGPGPGLVADVMNGSVEGIMVISVKCIRFAMLIVSYFIVVALL